MNFINTKELPNQQKNAASSVKEWGRHASTILELAQLCQEKKVSSTEATAKTVALIRVAELNTLPGNGDLVRDLIGCGLRNLAKAALTQYNDTKSALTLMRLGMQINTSGHVKEIFREGLAALESAEGARQSEHTCYFCGKHAPDEEGKLKKPIYKEISRSYFPRRVQYSQSEVELPRCKHCKKLHPTGRRIFWTVLSVLLIAGIATAFTVNLAIMLAGFIVIFAANWIALSAERGWASRHGIKPLQNGVLSRHPLMANLTKEKWQFVRPRA
jgi:hypothetical protein